MKFRLLILCCLAVFATLAADFSVAQQSEIAQDAIEVKLLEPGKPPFHKLRLSPTKDYAESSTMTMKMTQAIVMSGQTLPTPATPVMEFTIDGKVTDTKANGEYTFEFAFAKIDVVDDPEKPSPTAATLRTMLKSMDGMKGSTVMSDRGFPRGAEFTLPDNVAPQLRVTMEGMKESINRMGAPLPEEPIGVDGKWSVVQHVTVNGMTLKQTSIHTLKEVRGNVFTASVDVTQSAEPQDVRAPGLPPGAKLLLKSLESTGSGTMVIDSTRLFPTSNMTIASKASMEVNVGGQVQAMDTNTDVEMTITPADLRKTAEEK